MDWVSINTVLDLSGVGGLTPLWCLSTPQVFIDPHWFSQKYIADPLRFYHKSGTEPV